MLTKKNCLIECEVIEQINKNVYVKNFNCLAEEVYFYIILLHVYRGIKTTVVYVDTRYPAPITLEL